VFNIDTNVSEEQGASIIRIEVSGVTIWLLGRLQGRRSLRSMGGDGDRIQCELKATVKRIYEVKMAVLGTAVLLSQNEL
jgi:hypothetical protein